MSRLVPGIGPVPSPLCLVGEAPGRNEDLYGKPFIGEAGEELSRILRDANLGLFWEGVGKKRHATRYATNVFKHKPPDTVRKSNDIGTYFVSRSDPDACLDLPAYQPGKYLHAQYRDEVLGLVPELVGVGARVVIAFGATALWGLLGYQKISSYIGTVHPPTSDRPFYVIPTYHPAAILRAWGLRSTTVASLAKVSECLAKGGPRPNGAPAKRVAAPILDVKVNPTLDEVRNFARWASRKPVLAVDVETAHGQIRTISFAPSATFAFTIPFWEPPAASYWPTLDGELEAWKAVRLLLSNPACTYVGQNIQYDIQYLWRVHGIPILGPVEDTMLMHHSLEPELPKDLGTLAALYLDIPEWKQMVKRQEKEED